MTDPFVAEIRMFGFNFAPRGWATCNGQILPIAQNTALFSLLGTTYGGNGTSNFGLPNFVGSVPLHPGQGNGLSLRDLGETGGTETVTLLESEMPAHRHTLKANDESGDLTAPTPDRSLARGGGGPTYAAANAPRIAFSPQALPPAGGSLPHTNLQPYLTVLFCIALQGVFPQRH